MFAKSVILIALAFGVAHGSVVPVRDSVVEGLLKYMEKSNNVPQADATDFVDEIFANLRDEIVKNNLSTISIPESNFEFSQVIFGITWHGEASLTSGYVGGFETIHRTGPADLSVEPNGDIIILVDAGVNDGVLGASLKAVFMGMGVDDAFVTGTIKNIQVQLSIRVNIISKVASLEKFDIHNLGTLKIDVKGLGIILNFLAEIVVNVFGNLVKGVVGELLQGTIKNIINGLLAGILYPENLASSVSMIQQQAVVIPLLIPYLH